MKECDAIMNSAIVIGGDHFNTLWLVRSLGFVGICPDVILLNNKKSSFVCKSRYVHTAIVVTQEDELINVLENRKTNQKQVILSSSDVTTKILDTYYNQLKKSYILPNCNDIKEKIIYWMDKTNMLNVAKKVGINIPRSISVHLDDNNIDIDYKNIKFPCLIKPRSSVFGHKQDFRICYNKQEVENAIDSIKDSCKDILIQQYLKRDYEFVVNGVRCRENNEIPGIIRKVKVGKKLTNMGMTTFAFTDARTEDYIDVHMLKQMMEQIGYNGIYSIEFIVSDGIPYLLEINFRSDATLFISTTGGSNLPLIWQKLAVGNEITTSKYKRKAYGMAEISYIKELPWDRPWKIITDWWKTDCYSIFSWKDMKPFFYKFIYAI